MALAVQVHNASQDWHSSKMVVVIFGLFFFGENNETGLISSDSFCKIGISRSFWEFLLSLL